MASCNRPDPGKHPIVILLDAARADRLSSYGYGRETSPNIDRLAERGVLFLNHRPRVPIRASVCPSSSIPDTQSISMPRAFEKNVYSTVAISSHPCLRAESAFALGFQPLESGHVPSRVEGAELEDKLRAHGYIE